MIFFLEADSKLFQILEKQFSSARFVYSCLENLRKNQSIFQQHFLECLLLHEVLEETF